MKSNLAQRAPFRAEALLLGILVISGSAASLYSQQDRQLIQNGSAQNTTTSKRVALVIGNGAYASAPLLKNPPNDARDMARTLKELGFDVTSGINVNQKDMKRLIREFGQKLKSGGSGLFYYAGHGVQSKGRNFLIPVDAEIQSEAEVEDSSVDVNLVLSYMDEAQNGLNIVILDACRNNPFARSFRSATGGLAQVDAPTGTLIAYATAPGHVASDGPGQNGLYTSQLLKQMRVPGLSVTDMFMRVRAEIMKETGSKQVPWEASSLVGSFYFSGAAASSGNNVSTPETKSSDSAFELAYWDSIKNSTNPEDFRAYLKKYPTGTFVDLARNRLAASSAVGNWTGPWQNSKGERGQSTFHITEDANGVIKGDENGAPIVNGVRNGNVLTWEYHGVERCRDYRVKLEISGAGDIANGSYQVVDKCKNQNYEGTYQNYRKTSGTRAAPTNTGNSKSASSLEACFASIPAAGVRDWNNNYTWAQSQTLERMTSAMQLKLNLLFNCSVVSDAQAFDDFAAISVMIARYVPNASCFNGDEGVVGTDPAGHRGWAKEHGRMAALDNLKSKTVSALTCLEGARRASFYADVSVLVAGGTLK